MNKILMMGAFTGAMVFSLPASAADGQLNFKGNVVTAPCNMSADQADQTIEMGQHRGEGPSTEQNFTITLTDCTATPAQIAWTGDTDGFSPDRLQTDKPGLYIRIRQVTQAGDEYAWFTGGYVSLPDFTEGTNVISLSAFANANDWESVIPGDYTASASFTMRYD